jgi:hypothetical protein
MQLEISDFPGGGSKFIRDIGFLDKDGPDALSEAE